jgi:hypothetical protein
LLFLSKSFKGQHFRKLKLPFVATGFVIGYYLSPKDLSYQLLLGNLQWFSCIDHAVRESSDEGSWPFVKCRAVKNYSHWLWLAHQEFLNCEDLLRGGLLPTCKPVCYGLSADAGGFAASDRQPLRFPSCRQCIKNTPSPLGGLL